MVVNNGAAEPLSLHLGSATQGLYALNKAAPASGAGCLSYYFTVTTSGGA